MNSSASAHKWPSDQLRRVAFSPERKSWTTHSSEGIADVWSMFGSQAQSRTIRKPEANKAAFLCCSSWKTKDTPNRILPNWNNPLWNFQKLGKFNLHEGHLTSGSPESNDWQYLQMPSVRVRQGTAVSSFFLFLYGECVYQIIEMYILAYLVHMYKCQSKSLSKDACVRDGDELKSLCMCVCVYVCLENCSKSWLGRVFRLFHQTSSLDLLEPSAVKPSQEVIKAGPNFLSRATPSLASLRIPPYHLALQPQHPILLFSEKLELGCKVRQWR